MTHTKGQLRYVLHKHKAWLDHCSHTEKDDVRAGTRLSIHGSELTGADLQAVDIRHADLEDADLQGANLSYANLQYTRLQDADLRGATLAHANFYSANLQRADLRGADLTESSFLIADLRGAKLDMNICRCWGFRSALFTADALPWLILHPGWDEMKDSVQIDELP